MSFDSVAQLAGARLGDRRSVARAVADRLRSRGELFALLVITGVLNLWGLSINGWANTYYSAAVRSMDSSWHNFLFASLDQSGLMTVDKPPLSLWVQSLSARIFGFHSLSLLIPQALMGVAAVAITYDLVRRRFGRPAGFVAGLALATTPIVVAVSRHNNPDELLVLCSVAALWCALRALESRRTGWLVASGVCVGLGFETKMGVALMVVPGIAAAWMWLAPRGRRLRALRQLVAGGAAMAGVGLVWPLLVTLTPAADRPWISGTSDNSIWSLMFGYNGLGRVSGQSGGPQAFGGGGGGTTFGGPTGVFRMLQTGLGDQAGWLLGFALVSAVGIVIATRLRRRDPGTGWLIVVGGAFLTTAAVFSFASGIFHPYYVSLLAPFSAALIGAGVVQMLGRDRLARVIAPGAVIAGAVTELVVLGELSGELSWAKPLVIVVGALAAAALALSSRRRTRALVTAVALAALLAAPATWAADTLGHATSSTFPSGGPAGADDPGGAGGPGGPGRSGRGFPVPGRGLSGPGGATSAGPGGSGFGAFAPPAGFFPPAGAAGGTFGPPAGGAGRPVGGAGFGGANGPGGLGGFGGDDASLRAAISYVRSHGGGTIAVASQSTAAAAILASDANVAGIGGFSGRESSVTVAWLAMEIRDGHLRWVVNDEPGGGPGDTRPGSSVAMTAVTKACRAVTVSTALGTSPTSGTSRATGTTRATGSPLTLASWLTMYDCRGRASALAKL